MLKLPPTNSSVLISFLNLPYGQTSLWRLEEQQQIVYCILPLFCGFIFFLLIVCRCRRSTCTCSILAAKVDGTRMYGVILTADSTNFFNFSHRLRKRALILFLESFCSYMIFLLQFIVYSSRVQYCSFRPFSVVCGRVFLVIGHLLAYEYYHSVFRCRSCCCCPFIICPFARSWKYIPILLLLRKSWKKLMFPPPLPAVGCCL